MTSVHSLPSMEYELAPPLISSTLAPTMSNTDETPYELGDTRLLRLRKRQNIADIASSKSTLSVHRRSANSTEDDWQSDDGILGASAESRDDASISMSSHKVAFRSRRRLSSHRLESMNHSTIRHTNRHSPGGPKMTLIKSEQRWISMLERNSEELMSQIQTLTSDANQTEKRLRAQLEAAENEISSLKEHLVDRERAMKHVIERHTQVRNHRATKLESSRANTYSAPKTSVEHEMLVISKERDSFRSRCQRQDSEVLRLKKRNAELAEKILRHQGLEITVDGQNRYLLELSAALEETRRGPSAGSALSSEAYPSPLPSEAGAFSPLSLVSEQCVNQRPVSFDGTRWQEYSHLRNLSLPDLDLPRPHSTCLELPLSPPLTVKESSPLRDSHHSSGEEYRPKDCSSRRFEQVRGSTAGSRQDREQYSTMRPVLQRNESSLWAELHDDLDAKDLTSRRSRSNAIATESTAVLARAPTRRFQGSEVDLGYMAPRSQTFVAQMVRFKGDAMTNGLRVVLCGWVWLCFLCLLAVSVARVISEGPTGILSDSEPRLTCGAKTAVFPLDDLSQDSADVED